MVRTLNAARRVGVGKGQRRKLICQHDHVRWRACTRILVSALMPHTRLVLRMQHTLSVRKEAYLVASVQGLCKVDRRTRHVISAHALSGEHTLEQGNVTCACRVARTALLVLGWNALAPGAQYSCYDLKGGETRIKPSPRTNRKGIVLFCVCEAREARATIVSVPCLRAPVLLVLRPLPRCAQGLAEAAGCPWWVLRCAALSMRACAAVRRAALGAKGPTLMISSYVSSSISTVVMVSSTSPRIMFKCWS